MTVGEYYRILERLDIVIENMEDSGEALRLCFKEVDGEYDNLINAADALKAIRDTLLSVRENIESKEVQP